MILSSNLAQVFRLFRPDVCYRNLEEQKMATKPPDSGETGIDWESSEVAERRSRGRARRAEIQGPATELMLDLAEVRTGSRVLDVAAGTGDQTLTAAQRIGPTGYVLATDISGSMLKLAADAAREAGLTNVQTRVMNAENIDLDADSFDAAICQLGLFLFSNPTKVLYAMRGVVRPGGKVAALVFSTAEKNPYQGIPLGVAHRFGSVPLPLFSIGEAGMLENTFRESGLRDVTIRALSFRRHFSSTAEMIRRLKETAFLRGPIEKLGEAQREQAWVEIELQFSQLEGPNGVEIPGEFLIAAGTK
jgi:ubiquinone/menaquinone biosynthesis C-methylase UbiE